MLSHEPLGLCNPVRAELSRSGAADSERLCRPAGAFDLEGTPIHGLTPRGYRSAAPFGAFDRALRPDCGGAPRRGSPRVFFLVRSNGAPTEALLRRGQSAQIRGFREAERPATRPHGFERSRVSDYTGNDRAPN
jgi:hypothetical protein